MSFVKEHLVFCTMGVFFASTLLGAQCRASVHGRVIDAAGNPIPDADVSLVQVKATLGGNRYYGPFQTDSDGNFHASIAVPSGGPFFVSAKKESAGYPSTALMFYNDREPREFQLDCNVSRSGIVIELGPKAAFIQRISAVDASSGRPVPKASITLRRRTSPISRLPASAFAITTSTALLPPTSKTSGLPVPADVDLVYQISAPGYIDTPETTIRLSPEQDFAITAKLQPSSPDAN